MANCIKAGCDEPRGRGHVYCRAHHAESMREVREKGRQAVALAREVIRELAPLTSNPATKAKIATVLREL